MFSKFFGKKGGVEWIVAGLGNPEPKYNATRHNLGFEALDYIAQKMGASVTRSRFQALTATVKNKAGEQVLLMKPMTYMNLSGNAIGEAARFYKVPAEHVIVLCDDITLPAGTLRLREKGSAGGHNGLKSIIAQLGSDAFPRVKIGCGGNAPTGDELVDFVLGKPAPEDRKAIEARWADIEKAVALMLADDFKLAQSRYNGKGK
ncbi:MAG: aminoacyl-tRNA hydrolase [Oscillospiraceae bacterium]|nr:aminoacyl-tRNA hydrolase [Oscillospiraceae bacterium]